MQITSACTHRKCCLASALSPQGRYWLPGQQRRLFPILDQCLGSVPQEAVLEQVVPRRGALGIAGVLRVDAVPDRGPALVEASC